MRSHSVCMPSLPMHSLGFHSTLFASLAVGTSEECGDLRSELRCTGVGERGVLPSANSRVIRGNEEAPALALNQRVQHKERAGCITPALADILSKIGRDTTESSSR